MRAHDTRIVVNGGGNVTVGTAQTIRCPVEITVKANDGGYWISDLARADREDRKYHGFPGRQVKLQFRKKGAAHFATVKTVTTGDTRQLTTEVTDTAADRWSWYLCDFAI
ncbi:hypothetical protein [Streptomyces hokutonensis]|uniref:hypothetical protein n=1 Tax=Streptomyces hokutonensis TaxID=1306990 RepID=UPI00035E41C4|nr:hypothetical protein [Streptomyces hokutonensis]